MNLSDTFTMLTSTTSRFAKVDDVMLMQIQTKHIATFVKIVFVYECQRMALWAD